MFQNSQGYESSNALAVWRNLVQGVATVILGNRGDPFGPIGCKISGRQGTAMLGTEALNGLRDFATVKSFTLGLRNRPQAAGCGFELKQLAHIGGTSPR